MGFLSVGNIGPLDGQNHNIGKIENVNQEKLNSVFGNKVSQNQVQSDNDKAKSYAEFNSLLKQSPVKNHFLNESDLTKLGYKPTAGVKLVQGDDGQLTSEPDPDSQLMDSNGGLYYGNDKTGGSIRVCEFERSVEYKQGNMSHTQWFDDKGKPSGGMLVVTNKDGSTVEYRYENDINGNKFLTGIKKQEAENKYPADFNNALQETTLGSKFQTQSDFETQGWEKLPHLDMNGGIYYKNPQTGEKVRIMDQRLFGEGKTLTMTTDTMSHFAMYDNDGKETGGTIQVKQDDGKIKAYHYSVDIDGNKFIQSEEILNEDYFVDYE